MKNTFEDVATKISYISTQGNSPLEKWLHNLTDENIAELYVYHFVYGWLYIQDNELIQLNNNNIKDYFMKVCFAIEELVPDMEVKFFFQIYTDRFKKFREELSKVKKYQCFPSYFYCRVLDYPLMDNDFDSNSFSGNGEWSEEELTDMFAHQINYLQNHLDESFK